MNTRRWRSIAVVFVLAAIAISHLAIGMTGGGGVVLNATSGEPLAAAVVRLQCRDELLHGAHVLKELITTTDQDGKYFFGISEVWRCDSAFVRPERAGFVDTSKLDLRYDYTTYERIPAKLYLTPRGDEGLQKIKYHSAMSMSRGSNPTHQYFLVYEEFFQARKTAQTETERAFVRSSFCERLSALNAALSDDQRIELRQQSWNTAVRHEPIDHAAHVAPYCATHDTGSRASGPETMDPHEGLR